MKKGIGKFFTVSIHILEYVIAALSLVVLIALIGMEIYQMFTVGGYFEDPDIYIQNILTIVVGLEFVRMLINLTPANILEVLIVAIARQIIASHDGAWSNLLAVACIAGLFAIRKFLIPKRELSHEMATVKIEADEETRGEEKEENK